MRLGVLARSLCTLSLLAVTCSAACRAADIPEPFPRFDVPGHEVAMDRLREMFHLHHGPSSRPMATLWDAWLPMATLWADDGNAPAANSVRRTTRANLLNRRIDAEGYVSTHQHRGLAHNEGWPFPLWTQAGGVGWNFSLAGQPYGTQFGIHRVENHDGWQHEGIEDQGIDAASGWTFKVISAQASVAVPECRLRPLVAPFIRLAWRAEGLDPNSQPYLEWATEEEPQFRPKRRMYFDPISAGQGLVFTHIPVHRSPTWRGTITRLRLNFPDSSDAKITIHGLITAVDSRHNINNARYVEGCCDYLAWTGDLNFLRRNIQRMRLALRYAMEEFNTREAKCVETPWVGHCGRTGLAVDEKGNKTFHRGRGVGNNYWDLMPFGGKDALATIYYYAAVNRLARLESQIVAHPEWNIPAGPLAFNADELREQAREIKRHAGQLFWNDATGRFVAAIDVEGNAHDYGYTFVNCEAIYYDFATREQARQIVDWICGKRLVETDTSKGADIYHWRFGPRATTRRNIGYYMWAWASPEDIPWGGQVQDGGAVLGFSYHDLMARLETNGPDDAWNRLSDVLQWFGEVQHEGGYREYYKAPDRGTLQGGGPPGGLGLDREFFESVLVPQVMIYGFLGARPEFDGLTLAPRLPKVWPSLTIRGIQYHDVTLDITATNDTLRIASRRRRDEPLRIRIPKGTWHLAPLDEEGKPTERGLVIQTDTADQSVAIPLDKYVGVELIRK